MTSKLFQTLVVSSAVLLSTGCGTVVHGADDAAPDAIPMAEASSPARDATARDAMTVDSATSDASSAMDAAQDAAVQVDAAQRDARRREAGWPTTKGSFCEYPEVGAPFCCSYTDSIPGNGPGPRCCIIDPEDDTRCDPCGLSADRMSCDRNALDGSVDP